MDHFEQVWAMIEARLTCKRIRPKTLKKLVKQAYNAGYTKAFNLGYDRGVIHTQFEYRRQSDVIRQFRDAYARTR